MHTVGKSIRPLYVLDSHKEEEKIPEDETRYRKQQQASHLIQRHVNARLARLRNLSQLIIGTHHTVDPMLLLSEAVTLPSMASQREVVKRGLAFSQESGFSVLLASLPYLRRVELSKFVYSEESAYDELAWMEEWRCWVVQQRCENQVFAVEAHRLL